jgi:hypothetical protein
MNPVAFEELTQNPLSGPIYSYMKAEIPFVSFPLRLPRLAHTSENCGMKSAGQIDTD